MSNLYASTLANPTQTVNNAGGESFTISIWDQLVRFLILGTEGNTYYCSEKEQTKQNLDVVRRCIAEDGYRTVGIIREISMAGRAPKNDACVAAIALCMTEGNDSKHWAQLNFKDVCRFGTPMLQAASIVNARGWNRGLRRAFAAWFLDRGSLGLAHQLVKYQSRDGWSMKDVLRLCHPKTCVESMNSAMRWATKGTVDSDTPDIIRAFEFAKGADVDQTIQLIQEYGLPRECIKTEHLNDVRVWEALLAEGMGVDALIRNLATMTRAGIDARTLCHNLREAYDNARIKPHPLKILVALKTYEQGHGERGNNTWTPYSSVVALLDKLFYKSFKSVTPTGKRFMVAMDISGSMDDGSLAGMPGMTPRIGSAALALMLHRIESNVKLVAFETKVTPIPDAWASDSLKHFISKISSLCWGYTDCSAAIRYARDNRIPVDTFIIITDNESWYGPERTHEALNEYRRVMGIPAKIVAIGMTATEFSVVDPNDPGSLNVAGFDTAIPELIAEFSKM